MSTDGLYNKCGAFEMNPKFKSFRLRIDPIIPIEGLPLRDAFINAPSEEILRGMVEGIYEDKYNILIEEIVDFKHGGDDRYLCQFPDGRWEGTIEFM